MLIDSHCHLHDREFFTEEEAEEILEKAREKGVEKIICIGTNHEDSLAAKSFAESHENVYWTYGIHPEYAKRFFSELGEDFSKKNPSDSPIFYNISDSKNSADLSAIKNFSNSEHVVKNNTREYYPCSEKNCSRIIAIGEIGLDYHYGKDREVQIKLFRQMLQLAKDNNLPVSFHIREAFDDFFEIIKDYPEIRGVVHSFSDSKKNLKKILEQTNFYVGLNGLATYSTLPTPPLDRIILETDAPFLAPIPHRGEKNDPSNIKEIADWLAQKLNTTPEEIAKITTQNVENLFKI